MNLYAVYVFVALCLVGGTQSQTYENMSKLYDDLLLSYNPDIRPLNNQSDVLMVNITVVLFGISEVDQVRGSVTYIVQVVAEWYDERMVWNPADYGGINDILVPSEDMWTPPLSIGNPIEFTKLGHKWMQVAVLSDGRTFYTPSDVLDASCVMYLKYWPFDKQICQLSFFTFGYYATKLDLNVSSQIASFAFYNDNGEWTLDRNNVKYTIDRSFGLTLIKYNFRLTRQSTFYLLTIILPIKAIGMLTCLVFLLPADSGERVSYSITILLALAVFMTVITEDLPKTSDPVPIICVWILFGIVACIAGLGIVILNLMLYHRDDKIPIPPWYVSLVKLTRCKLCARKPKETLVERIDLNTLNYNEQGRKTKNTTNVSKYDTYDSSRKVETKDSLPPAAEYEEDLTWKDVSVAMDKLVLWSMLILAYIPSVIILMYVALASDFVDNTRPGF